MPTLDAELLTKMALKKGKPKQYLREQISRRANRSTVSSLAAQLLWAKEMGIGIALPLRRAHPSVRDEVRENRPTTSVRVSQTRPSRENPHRAKRASVAGAINFVLQDLELRGRCRDLLLAKKHYDRVVREATTVLDDRLKTTTGIAHMNPAALVGKVLSPDPTGAVIVVSADKDEQQGVFNMCSGVMLAFRNKAHHSLSNSFTQTDALKVCAFIDALLAVIGKGALHLERV
jgi:uncharacterized protein (TIGR02391 family)